ncbi:helicase-related protein [Clostridium butyricum]|uniref:helicase-related protein n=1 Tax=Clostridium butyricum TaxID=1492 RepID=UPI00136F7375|nr:helicase-related protein [Clostridium butyricum]MZI80323.1 helicase [Clostridium butyricum]
MTMEEKINFDNECIDTREKIYEEVKRELVGPGSEDIGCDIEHELITDAPITRYSTGILFPLNSKITQDIDSLTELENDQNKYDEDDFIEDRNQNNEMKIKDKIISNGESELFQEKINLSNERKPSSMGFTFFTKGRKDKLKIHLKGAKYRKSTYKDACIKCEGKDYIEECNLVDYIYKDTAYLKLKQDLNYRMLKDIKDKEKYKEDAEYRYFINAAYQLSRQSKGDKYEKDAFVREPIPFKNTITIELDGEYTKYNQLPKEYIASNNEKINLNLDIIVYRKQYDNNIYSYTVVLINNEVCESYGIDEKSIFQAEIKILSKENDNMIFVENRNNIINKKNSIYDNEEEKLNMLYSKKKNYAIGHGVSVMQEIDLKTGMGQIYTSYLPSYIVKGISFDIDGINKEESKKILSMKNLSDYSEINKNEIIDNLNRIVISYDNWIDSLKKELNIVINENPNYEIIGKNQIKECEECSFRIKSGIKLLISNDQVFLAFKLMNRALMMQRIQGQSARRDRYPDDKKIDYPEINFKEVEYDKAVWRPFQLAYILMCLESIANPKSTDRDLVDLIWVPTGGGKTEAYLGLTAFTIFLRRLKDKNNGGTTIIMRYTLRLLAAQQFSRASILICACELIRKQMVNKLGKERITIGLWIGSKQTPNNRKKAEEVFYELTDTVSNKYQLKTQKEKNMFQVLKCPWCGTKLEKDYDEDNLWGYDLYKGKLRMFCPEEECEFNKSLPIEIVDDDIYKNPPTLLFGTVDKFAMTTWNSGAGNLFGIGSKTNSTPELIIQDELHLISGSLGTIVGQYETVIDELCSNNIDSTRPKIVASTATIRNAVQQCNQLYCRSVKQFPPSGLYEDDSFFTKEDKNSFGRKYVGIMPAGKTLTTTQVRLMSNLLNKVKMLDIDEKVKSKYWTLVGYFNTIKELGMTRSLMEADIQDNINIVSTRLLERYNARRIFNYKELTSRVSASEINNTLKDLEIEYSQDNRNHKKYAIDTLLASNMISVGVDVSRLNLMMVLEQPKLTSEYIQATSRVGRENPGIVFTLYNPTRSRDKSYYELFYDYHQSFYKYVEPTSVTSFSEQARDRMLHSVFLALVRHGAEIESDNEAYEIINVKDKVEKYKDKILARVRKIMIKERVEEEVIESELKNVSDELNRFEKKWIELAEKNKENLKYSNYDRDTKGEYRYLIKPYGKDKKIDGEETLQAMRNVDGQGSIEIIQFGDEKHEDER